jgi:hypothetical protein
MSFRAYMRCEGWVAIAVGASLYAFGLVEGHQGPADAVLSGVMMIAGTGIFMVARHGVPFREPAAWFTYKPLASAAQNAATWPRRSLLIWLLGETAAFAVLTVALSFLTGFWLTFMDFGVWAMAIGGIKVGPAAAAIAQHEACNGVSYHVARRRVRGLVELAWSPRSDTGPLRAAMGGARAGAGWRLSPMERGGPASHDCDRPAQQEGDRS